MAVVASGGSSTASGSGVSVAQGALTLPSGSGSGGSGTAGSTPPAASITGVTYAAAYQG